MDAVFTALGDAMVATSEAQAESAKAWSDGAIELCGALWAFVTGEGATLAVGTVLAVFVFVATATGGPLAAGLCVCAAVAVGTGGAAVVTVGAFTLAVEAIFSSVIVPLLLIPMVLLTSLDDAVIGLGNWIFLPAAQQAILARSKANGDACKGKYVKGSCASVGVDGNILQAAAARGREGSPNK